MSWASQTYHRINQLQSCFSDSRVHRTVYASIGFPLRSRMSLPFTASSWRVFCRIRRDGCWGIGRRVGRERRYWQGWEVRMLGIPWCRGRRRRLWRQSRSSRGRRGAGWICCEMEALRPTRGSFWRWAYSSSSRCLVSSFLLGRSLVSQFIHSLGEDSKADKGLTGRRFDGSMNLAAWRLGHLTISQCDSCGGSCWLNAWSWWG